MRVEGGGGKIDHLAAEPPVSVSFYQLAPSLRRYFTPLYCMAVNCGPGEIVEDYLYPEWAALRFIEGSPPFARIGSGGLRQQSPFIANGPTSKVIHFGVATSRIWGFGMHPAAWARFVGEPASNLADTAVDGRAHRAFAKFAPLLDQVVDSAAGPDAVAARINDHLLSLQDAPAPDEEQIFACESALRDPDISEVGELGETLAISLRSLERFCLRHFGFPPKLLLRRQRILRSIAFFMLDPTIDWIRAIDDQYYDQAQFVRDFRSFMGMTPSEYAAAPHPILGAYMARRMRDRDAAARIVDLPSDRPPIRSETGPDGLRREPLPRQRD